jgi:type I restriction enzyme S subunit
MAGEWTTIRLGDVCFKIGSGATPRGGSRVYPGHAEVALIRSQNVYNDGFHRDGLVFITPEHANELENVEVVPGDVLLNITGDSVARCCQVDDSVLPARVNQHVAIIRPNPTTLDPRFLRYLLVSPDIQARLLSWARSGGTRNALTKGMIESLKVLVPVDVDEQRAIAHILGTLDDKIELNRRMNETLEAIARALFKSWFVDFEPVRAKMEGRWRKGESLPGLPARFWDLFPDRLVQSELGEIPEGWEVGTLGDVADHSRHSIQPDNIEPGTPYIALEHIPKRCIALSEWSTADGLESTKFVFKRGEILFGKLRPYFHKVGVAPVDGVCSTDIVVVSPESHDWFGFVLGHISSSQFIEYTNAGSTGTKMPRTSWNDMARYGLTLPPEPTAQALNALVQPLIERMAASVHESRGLAALRDALLPNLISGEIRVTDTERFLGTTPYG